MTRRARPRRGCRAPTVFLGTALVLPMVGAAPAASGTTAQVVRSGDGIVASGTIDRAAFPDGTERHLSVMLVVPRGSVDGAGGGAAVDVSRPWVLVNETVVSDPASGHRTIGTRTCSGVSNPDRWDAGYEEDRMWKGTSVDARCADGSEQRVYRVEWEPSWILVANPLATAWMSSHVTRWSAAGAEGSMASWPTANQRSRMTLCAMGRSAVNCYTGSGVVVPSMDGMVVTAAGR